MQESKILNCLIGENLVEVQAVPDPQYTPGSTTLWKGRRKTRLASIFQENGIIAIQHLYSSWPSDFGSGETAGIYTAINRKVAQIYV